MVRGNPVRVTQPEVVQRLVQHPSVHATRGKCPQSLWLAANMIGWLRRSSIHIPGGEPAFGLASGYGFVSMHKFHSDWLRSLVPDNTIGWNFSGVIFTKGSRYPWVLTGSTCAWHVFRTIGSGTIKNSRLSLPQSESKFGRSVHVAEFGAEVRQHVHPYYK